MTDEERQKLCDKLRSTWSTVAEQIKAADEIERLVAELEDAKRYDMRDWNNALERGRKNPI